MEGKHEEMLGEVIEIARADYPELPYHNFAHGMDVWNTARQYAKMAGIGGEERFALETAAVLHDVIVIPERTDNELESAMYAADRLPDFGYSIDQTTRVGEIIVATVMPQDPKDLSGRIICDADLGQLGRPDFLKRSENLREEWDKPHNLEWLEGQVAFLEGHKYHTDIARRLRDPGKARNVELVKGLIRNYKKK
ncbi:metal-dependent phosphohydrolase [archaeon]|nr:metal-dependent phosphohydrolase [archaeon]MBT3578167.1 metal-dependent phosphohydrolase [archaeon]MBT6820715.1 metal-dependent phosphohydrolase [archaeon]MBT6955976.1 metal-dependent phosphohydrolase [archaeon]MBT7024876.1 metal-dependent phosphohydrolase [archaeon]